MKIKGARTGLKLRGSATGIAIKGVRNGDVGANLNFSISAVARDELISGSNTGTTTIADSNYDTYTSATVDHEWDIKVTPFSLTAASLGFTYESSNEAIATIDSSGLVTREANGTVTITVTSGHGVVRTVTVTVHRQGGTTSNQFVSFVDGSLAQVCCDSVDSRLSGKQKAIYSTQDHTTPIYVRNVVCWIAGINSNTGISPWNSAGVNHYAGTVIARDTIIFAEHYQIPVGATVRFITADNQIITRTITAKLSLPGGSGYETDLTLGLLSEDLPETITHVKVLPANWSSYLPGVSNSVPVLGLDQEEKALVCDMYYMEKWVYNKIPVDATRLSFYETIVSGDSGNPCFLVVDNELVLLATWTFGGAGTGPAISYYITQINSLMTTLGSEYQLTQIDLSSYPSYA